MCGLSNVLGRPLSNGSYINYCEHNTKLTTGQLIKKYSAPPLTEPECSLPRSLPDPIPTSMNPVQDLKHLSRFNSLLSSSKWPFLLRFPEKTFYRILISPVRVMSLTHLGRLYFIPLNRIQTW
jgi:hypothetical protein